MRGYLPLTSFILVLIHVAALDLPRINDVIYMGFDQHEPNRTQIKLNGMIVRCSVVVTYNETIGYLGGYKHRQMDSVTKMSYVLVRHLADYLNITLHIRYVTNWSYKDGMFGDLVNGTVDIGGTGLFMVKERIDHIDYISSTGKTHSLLMFRSPKLSAVQNIFLLPFSRAVWIALLALLVFASVVFYKVLRGTNAVNVYTFPEVFLSVFGAMCQQGSAIIARSFRDRCAAFIIFFSLMLIYTSYSANIVALLQTPSNSIRTMRDLLNSRYQISAQDEPFIKTYFAMATDPTRKAILKRMADKSGQPRAFSMSDGAQKVRDGFFAFLGEESTFYYTAENTYYEHEKCDLTAIEFFKFNDPHMAIRKGLPYRDAIAIGARRIHEVGLLHAQQRRVYVTKPRCDSKVSAFVSVAARDCFPIFVITGLMVMAALVIFTGELVYNRYLREKRNLK